MATLHSYYSRQQHYYPTLPVNTGAQYVVLSGYVEPGYGLMYSDQRLVPVPYLQYYPQSFVQCDDSWIMNTREEQGNYRDLFIQPFDESLIMSDQEEEEDEPSRYEEELWQIDLIGDELVFYDTTRDDDGLSEETVADYLITRNSHPVNAHDICVVCQDSLFQKEEKIATLDCGHDFHAGCIKSWLMIKNRCPLCKATGIHLQIHEEKYF